MYIPVDIYFKNDGTYMHFEFNSIDYTGSTMTIECYTVDTGEKVLTYTEVAAITTSGNLDYIFTSLNASTAISSQYQFIYWITPTAKFASPSLPFTAGIDLQLAKINSISVTDNTISISMINPSAEPSTPLNFTIAFKQYILEDPITLEFNNITMPHTFVLERLKTGTIYEVVISYISGNIYGAALTTGTPRSLLLIEPATTDSEIFYLYPSNTYLYSQATSLIGLLATGNVVSSPTYTVTSSVFPYNGTLYNFTNLSPNTEYTALVRAMGYDTPNILFTTSGASCEIYPNSVSITSAETYMKVIRKRIANTTLDSQDVRIVARRSWGDDFAGCNVCNH